MAITGTTITVNVPGTTNGMTGRVVWSYTQDINANTSEISASLQYRTVNGPSTTYTGTNVSNFYLTVAGTTVNKTNGLTVPSGSSWTTALTITKTVEHAADGTYTVSISAGGGMPATSGLPNSSGSGAYPLQTIPRGSTITEVTGTNIGSQFEITVSDPTGGSNYHEITYTFSGNSNISGTVTSSRTNSTSYLWTPAYGTFGAAIPDRTSGTLTLTLKSYTSASGSTRRGVDSVFTKTITMPNNSSTRPTVGNLTAEDTVTCRDQSHGTIAAFIGKYVKGYSKPKFTTTAATGKYSAAITSYSFAFEGTTLSGQSLTQTFGSISSATNQTCTLTVTDSRGFAKTSTLTLQITDYETPALTKSNIKRNTTTTSTVNATASGTAYNISNNTLQIFVSYKLKSSSYYGAETELTGGTSGTSGNYKTLSNATAALTNIDGSSSYNFKLIVKDAITTYSQEYSVGTSQVGLHIGPSYLGVGKIHERGALDVGGNIIATPSIIATDTGKTLHDDGLRGAMLNRFGRLYLQGDSSNSPQINFYGNSSSNTSPTSTIRELTDGELTVNADFVAATGKTIKAGNLPNIENAYLSSAGSKSFTLTARHSYLMLSTRHAAAAGDNADFRILAVSSSASIVSNVPIVTASFVSVSTSGATVTATTSDSVVRIVLIDLGSYL